MSPVRSLAVALALLGAATFASAAQAVVPLQTITSTGPITRIALGNDLSCQMSVAGDPQPSFEPVGSTLADCGTYMLVNDTTSGATTLFGPSDRVFLPAPDQPYTPDTSFHATGQDKTDTSTTHTVDSHVLLGSTGLTADQVDVYNDGDALYTSAIQLSNPTGTDSFHVTVYRVFLCYLQGGTSGDFGSHDLMFNTFEHPGCTTGPGVSPARSESLTGVTVPAGWVVADYHDADTLLRGGGLPGTCLCGQSADLLVGLSWERDLAPGDTADAIGVQTTSSGPEGSSKPVAAKSGNASTQSGTVLIQVPGGKLVPLVGNETIPVGSIVDTTKGVVTLTAAASGKRKTQRGTFGGGVFKFTQSKAKSHGKTVLKTKLSLRGGSFSACRTRSAGGRSARRREVRYLQAKANGQFAVVGKYSTGLERGTTWRTSDGCDGTLTSVTKGTVAVTDRVRKKTILVHAGHSYLARAP